MSSRLVWATLKNNILIKKLCILQFDKNIMTRPRDLAQGHMKPIMRPHVQFTEQNNNNNNNIN